MVLVLVLVLVLELASTSTGTSTSTSASQVLRDFRDDVEDLDEELPPEKKATMQKRLVEFLEIGKAIRMPFSSLSS